MTDEKMALLELIEKSADGKRKPVVALR
jgi:hypothetical protein